MTIIWDGEQALQATAALQQCTGIDNVNLDKQYIHLSNGSALHIFLLRCILLRNWKQVISATNFLLSSLHCLQIKKKWEYQGAERCIDSNKSIPLAIKAVGRQIEACREWRIVGRRKTCEHNILIERTVCMKAVRSTFYFHIGKGGTWYGDQSARRLSCRWCDELQVKCQTLNWNQTPIIYPVWWCLIFPVYNVFLFFFLNFWENPWVNMRLCVFQRERHFRTCRK